jgi:hypothetical protein
MLQLRGQPHGQLPGLQQVERGKSGACTAGAHATHPDQWCIWSARRKKKKKKKKVVKPQPSAKQESLGPGWNHVVKGGRVVKATLPTPPEPAPRPVTEIPQQDKMTEHKGGGEQVCQAGTQSHEGPQAGPNDEYKGEVWEIFT